MGGERGHRRVVWRASGWLTSPVTPSPGARAHEKAAVAVRGPLTGLLLIVYRRRPARGESIEIIGDEQLLDFWLERVNFG